MGCGQGRQETNWLLITITDLFLFFPARVDDRLEVPRSSLKTLRKLGKQPVDNSIAKGQIQNKN